MLTNQDRIYPIYRSKELEREIAQLQLAAKVESERRSFPDNILVSIGRTLVSTGTWLEKRFSHLPEIEHGADQLRSQLT